MSYTSLKALQILHLINISKSAGRGKKTQGSHRELNPGPPPSATGALATEPWLLTATQAISLQL